ncbi:unnamed protein product [Phaeothamnion confervicola]
MSVSGPYRRPLTPFMLYYCEHRDVVAAALPNAPPEDISRTIAERWRGLPEQSRKAYCLMANTYTENVPKYGPAPALPGKRKRDKKERRKRDPREPRPPVSAYVHFNRHHRLHMRHEHRVSAGMALCRDDIVMTLLVILIVLFRLHFLQ